MIDLKGKKILITGGAGFLGSHIVRVLVGRGVSESLIVVPRFETHDLRKRSACEAMVDGVQLVVHAAGTTGDAEFHRDHPAEIIHDNLVMGVELMDAARRAGAEKFVAIGSATEYPENAPLPYREENLWTGAVASSHAPYTIAKKMLLVQGQAYRAQYGFNAVHLLLTNMYGPGSETRKGFVITNIIRRILGAQREGKAYIEVWGTGQATRDFLYVADAAEGVVQALEAYDDASPVNLGSGWEISIRELTELIARLMGFEGEIRWDKEKPEGPPRRMLDITKAERAFGFSPKTTLAEGLKATIAWHVANSQ
ncbi:MAG: GDP-fucose synthetase [Candidatus Liptonbacteria bacterium RIFCSPLOWO2_01_FULL_53_13]|uniref:GDP-L-fucose synthase n=1 Tax=Candidatus Liptonbacteria bacterium RIFCSPLOWO2_01_FULL_53_13 TaxID=1798651 RepID=A0A1G2CKK5_9BACT|nr:MAG: GDP-fucose synthetase [Candidatus Liptonbacteria bacterium RIFCSPLOWO2_01_FULL_53_13]